jgi:hypothetical protein
MTIKLWLSLGMLVSLALQAAPRVELRVADAAGVVRTNEVVVSGVPFAPKALRPGAVLRVETAAERAVPTETRVLGTWPDGSTKWLLVQFPATVAAHGTAKYFLTEGEAPKPARAIRIDETVSGVTVDTGALRMTISKNRFELLGPVTMGARKRLVASPATFELADGSLHSSLRSVPESIVVEDRGPVRATVKVVGWLTGPKGEKYYRIESRLRFFAGQAQVEGDHTFTVLGGPHLQEIRRISYELETPGNGVDVAVRDFQHLGPNDIERSARGVRIDIWSPRGGQVLRFGRGRAKTHRILYDFTKGLDRMRAFQEPLAAVPAPEYFCATGALGTLAPFGAPETKEYDQKIDITFESLLRTRNTDPRESGMQHYGDYFHGGYGNKRTRGDLEYDTAHALFLEYARSGDRRYYDYAVQCNQHFIDMDVNHETGEQLFHGYGEMADTHEAINTRLEWGHVFTDGEADMWFLTGDERSLETLKEIADQVSKIADGEGYEKIRRIMAGAERQIGWPLLALCRAYEVTHEPRYLAVARKVVDYIKLYAADPDAEYRNGTWWRSWMEDGCKPFMVGALHEGLGAYYELTADRSLIPVIVKSLDWLIDHMWDPQTDSFVYEYNAMNRGNRMIDPSLNMMVVDAFRSGYEITGDERYLAVALHTFWSRVHAMKAPMDGKYFTIDARTSPHTAAFLWRKKLMSTNLPAAPQPKHRVKTAVERRPRPEVLLRAHFEGSLPSESGSVGKISFTEGRHGQGLALGKAGHAWLPVPADLLRAPGTIELWVRLNQRRTAASPRQESIFQIDGERPLVDSLGLVAIYNELRVRLTDEMGTLDGTAEADVKAWNPGEWHHVAISWNDRRVRLYLDGVEQVRPGEGKTLWDSVDGLPTGTQSRMHLGWRFGNWYGDSTIDELTVYGREFTAGEIQACAAAPPSR